MLKWIFRNLRQSLVLTLLGIMTVAAGVQACGCSDSYEPPSETFE